MATGGAMQDVYTIQIPLHRRYAGLSPYCETCKNGVVHLSSLEVRKFTETGKLPNVCKSCTKEFLKICRVQLRSLSERETLHSCEICGRSFIHAGNLKKHKNLHDEATKPSTSKESTESVNGEGEDASEMDDPASTYVGFENRLCVCKDCGKDITNEYSFLKHCQFHSIKNMFACGPCNQLFEDVDQLKIHSLSHEEKSEYICNICPLTFVKMCELKTHCLSVHDKTFRPEATELDNEANKHVFSCDACGKTFIQKGAYLKHCEQHTSQAPFRCQICNKIFTSDRRLNTHQVSHKKVRASMKGKLFTCKVCKKNFKSRKTYTKHRAVHKK